MCQTGWQIIKYISIRFAWAVGDFAYVICEFIMAVVPLFFLPGDPLLAHWFICESWIAKALFLSISLFIYIHICAFECAELVPEWSLCRPTLSPACPETCLCFLGQQWKWPLLWHKCKLSENYSTPCHLLKDWDFEEIRREMVWKNYHQSPYKKFWVVTLHKLSYF